MASALDRRPDARLHRARDLSHHWEQQRQNHRYEDQVVLTYAKFLHDLRTVDGLQQERLMAVRPVMAEVHVLLSSGTEFSFMEKGRVDQVSPVQKDRSLLKAMILTGASPDEITRLLDYSPSAISLFESLAWDVRSRMDKRGWVHNYVFGPAVYDSTSVNDFDRMCLQAAYIHGMEGVKRLLFLGTADHAGYIRDMRSQVAVDLANRAGVAIRTMPLNSHTSPELVNGYQNWDKKERELSLKEAGDPGAQDGDDEEGSNKAVMKTLTSVGFSVFSPKLDSQDETADEERCAPAFQKALAEAIKEAQLEVSK